MWGRLDEAPLEPLEQRAALNLRRYLPSIAFVWIRTRVKSQDVWGGLDEWVIRPLVQSAPHVLLGRVGQRAFVVTWGFGFGANRLIPGPFWEETRVLGDLLRVDSSFRGASPLLCVAVSRVPTRPPCMFLVVVCWIGVCVGVPAMPSGVWCTASRVHAS